MTNKVFSTLAIAFFSFSVFAQETPEQVSKDLSVSIYNNNLALVRDTRAMRFQQGSNSVIFEGVAASIKPESVIISADKTRVLEQNYDYALLTPYNIAEKSVGEKIKTLRINPKTGENILEEAELISYQERTPVLRFDYGIEANFDGRLVFEKIPAGLTQKPTLAAKIFSLDEGLKDVMLAYLTSGMSWKANYVAFIKNEDTLDLTAWVSITNDSGVSYNNAAVQLIAGEVNELPSYDVAMPRMAVMTKGVALNAAEDAEYMPSQESFNAYQLYTIKERTDIADNQTKQLSLLEQNDVKYQKEGRIDSPLYFEGENVAHFTKKHPTSFYILHNDSKSNLGVPLPKGVVRFYEDDSQGVLQFVGEDRLEQTAKGEKIELRTGKMSDVFVNGKIEKVQKTDEKILKDSDGRCPRYRFTRLYHATVDFNNGGQKEAFVVFRQPLGAKTVLYQESIKGKVSEENANLYQWGINLAPDGKETLQFSVEKTTEEARCH